MAAVNVVFDIYHSICNGYNNDAVDRLHNIITPHILLSLCLIAIFRIFVIEEIICFENPYELSEWTSFAETYCFVGEKYFVSEKTIDFPRITGNGKREATYINYYQWVPFVFVIQAICFLIPYWIWKNFNYVTGHVFYSESKPMYRDAPKSFVKILKFNFLRIDNIYGMILPTKFVSYCYLFYKFVNVFNVILQILFLNKYLNMSYYFWGAEVLRDIMKGKTWKETGCFPRVVYCDYPRRDDLSGKPFESTVMCLLPHSYIYEVVFIFVWLWLMLLLFISLISYFNYFYFFISREKRIIFVESYLEIFGINREDPYFYKFVDTVLAHDGFTALKIFATNSSFKFASEFIFDLWHDSQIYFPIYHKKAKHN